MKSYLYIFIILFLLFCWAFITFWNTYIIQETAGSTSLMYKSATLLVGYGVIVWASSKKSSISGIHVICLLWTILMPIMMFLNRSTVYIYFMTILWPVLFETTCIFCSAHKSNIVVFKKIFILLAIYGLILFLQTRVDTTDQSNTVFFVMLTLPWLLYRQKRRNGIIIMLLFTVVALLSFKRSAMLTMVLVWLFYFIESIGNRKNKLYVITVFVILLIGIDQIYDRIDEVGGGTLSTRVNREETDDGRNRLAIWNYTIFMIQSSPIDKLLTGHGHGAVKKDSFLEISAHNDFLEVIYDYGLVIFFLYLCLWWYVLRKCFGLYRNHSSFFLPYAASLSIFIIDSMVSHLILYTSYFNYLVMFWGMIEALTSSAIFRRK